MASAERTKPSTTAPLLIDGGTGTELRRRGAPLDPIAWSGLAALTHSEILTAIHADYLAAGADVITTNTFACTRFVLDAKGFGSERQRIVRASVEAARAARDRCGRDALIAGALSCFPPGFDVRRYPKPDDERAAYLELAAGLADAGVDLIVLEMMEDTEHARRACDAVREIGLPFWLGVSVRRARDGRLVAYDFPGTPFEAVLDALLGFRPEVVNVMHSPPRDVKAALRALGARFGGAIGAYPETGEPLPDGRPGESLDAESFAALAATWLDEGVAVLGGCCGTTPAHIRALRALLDRRISGGTLPPAPADRPPRRP